MTAVKLVIIYATYVKDECIHFSKKNGLVKIIRTTQDASTPKILEVLCISIDENNMFLEV